MSDDTIFSEVDEDLRADRMRQLWRRFGPWLLGAAVLVVLLVAVNEGWRWYRDSVAAASSDKLYAAMDLLDSGDIVGAQAALNEVIASGSGSYPELARFAQAAILADQGKVDEAVAAYDALANTLTNTRLRETALLLAAQSLADSGDVDGVRSRLAGLLAPDNPFRSVARETLGLTEYAAGDADAARREFEQIINDPQTSLDLLRRVQIFDAQLRSEGAADPSAPDEPATEAPASDAPAADAPADPAADAPADPAAADPDTASQ